MSKLTNFGQGNLMAAVLYEIFVTSFFPFCLYVQRNAVKTSLDVILEDLKKTNKYIDTGLVYSLRGLRGSITFHTRYSLTCSFTNLNIHSPKMSRRISKLLK